MNPQQLFSSLEAKYRLPEGYLSRVYQLESSGGKNLYNEQSGAAGPFQFMPQTARGMGLQDPYDLAQSADAAARLAAQNRAYLQKKGVEEVDGRVLYLAHVQGADGAYRLMENADRPAVEVVGQKPVVQNAGRPEQRAGEFAGSLMDRYQPAQQQAEPYAALGTSAPVDQQAAFMEERADPRAERRQTLALNTLLGLSKDLQQQEAPPAMLPIPRLSYAEGGIVGLVTNEESEGQAEGQYYSDLSRKEEYKPLNYKALLDSGAIRITQPGSGTGPDARVTRDPEQWSLVTKYNDLEKGSYTSGWADKPEAYENAIRELSSSTGALYDGKYRQILWSARQLGLTPDQIFLPEGSSSSASSSPQRFAEGGIVGLVEPTAPRPAAGINVPETTQNVVDEIGRIAKKGDLDEFKIAFLLRMAATNTIPEERAMEFADEIVRKDVPALLRRFKRYPRALRMIARLNLALGGLAGQGYGSIANQHPRAKPQPTKRMGHDTKMAKSFAEGGEVGGHNEAAQYDLSRYAINLYGPEIGSNMIRRSEGDPNKLLFALNQYAKNVVGVRSPAYAKNSGILQAIAKKHRLKPVEAFNRTEDALATEQELDRLIRDVPKKDRVFRDALLRMKAMVGWKPKPVRSQNGRRPQV